MKATIIAIGSRGDVQPYTALGKGLKDAGYEVCLATHKVFKNFAIDNGLQFMPVLPENPREFLLSSAGQLYASGNPLSSFIGGCCFFKSFGPMVEKILDNCYEACAGSDIVLSSILAPGHQAAEKLGVPCITTGVWPASPTKYYPHPVVTVDLGKSFNKLGHSFIEFLMWLIYKKPANKWRKKYGLPPLKMTGGVFGYVREKNYPWLFGFSPSVLPAPDDWPEYVKAPGYWFLDEPEEWNPSEGLLNFIEAGEPPVYVGFGSMIYKDKEKFTEILIEALRLSGQRAVLHEGWSRLGEGHLPENIFKVGSVPHSWLFPKMAGVICHGGSGTTAAALRAGVPALVIPFLSDQFFWGRRVYEMGAGPEPLPKRKLTSEKLAEAINQMVSSREIKDNAVKISAQIKNEDGVKKALEVIENCLNEKNQLLS